MDRGTKIKLIVGFVVLLLVFTGISYLIHVWLWNITGWSDFGALSTFIYTAITFVTIAIIVIAAVFAARQLEENVKTRKLNTAFELWKTYSTEEMYHAIRTVWNTDWNDIKSNPEKSNQRHIVSDFYNLIAWAFKERLIEPDFIYSRFGRSALDIWEKRLRDMELELRREIERSNLIREGEVVDEQLVEQRARRHVDEELPISSLYKEWIKRYPPPPPPRPTSTRQTLH